MKQSLTAQKSQAQPILLSPVEAITRLNYLLVLDVQNPKFATSTVPKAQRLNVDVRLQDIAKTQSILLICLYGKRSLAGAQELIKRGYSSVYVLKGGLIGWRQAGYPAQSINYPA